MLMYENLKQNMLRRSLILIISGLIIWWGMGALFYLLPPLIFPDVPFISAQHLGVEITSEEYMKMHNSIPYLKTVGQTISNAIGMTLLVVGIAVYFIDKRKGKPIYFSNKNKPVDVGYQIAFVFFPGLDLYAFYKVKKLRMYLLIILAIAIPTAISVWVLSDSSYNYLIITGVTLSTGIYFIQKWSRKWNKQFDNPEPSNDGNVFFTSA